MNKYRVLCQIIVVLCILPAHRGHGQQPDSIHRVSFPQTSTSPVPPIIHGRTIDGALSGGAGFYSRNTAHPLQVTANADFLARSETLNLIAGAHFGFSHPVTAGLSLGLRFPISESIDQERGLYGDASLLFFDDGADSGAFHTGLRAAFTGRLDPFEVRVASELRKSPLDGNRFEAWAGLEVGCFLRLHSEGHPGPTRKDTVRASLKYVATTKELEDLNETSGDDEIDAWLDRFWTARNVTGSRTNDARHEYMRRIKLANDRYGSPRIMGVSTDMGRVLLVYGEPDRTESAASISDLTRRYTLWIDEDRVALHKTAVFLFLTIEGESSTGIFARHGEYREVYSNVPGEPSEGIPYDLPPAMASYINSFGR